MINFSTAAFTKMDHAGPGEAESLLDGMLLSGETVHAAFKGANKVWAVFTDRRLIAVTAQGMTGRKRDYTTLPYSGISAASVDANGGFDAGAGMDLWWGGLGFSMLGTVPSPCILGLEFVPGVDVLALERFVLERTL